MPVLLPEALLAGAQAGPHCHSPQTAISEAPASVRAASRTGPCKSACHRSIVYSSAIIASRGTPLWAATARRIELKVPSRSGWWSGIAIL